MNARSYTGRMVNIRMSSTVQRELLARWEEYRTERHRQEIEMEGLSGGHDTDAAFVRAKGLYNPITFKDWLKGQSGKASHDAQDKANYDPNYVHTPDPDKWGTPEENNAAPPW